MAKSSSTKNLYAVLMVIIVVVALTRPSCVDCRVIVGSNLVPENKVVGLNNIDGVSSSSSKASCSNNIEGREQVYKLASGPSRKGTGHK